MRMMGNSNSNNNKRLLDTIIVANVVCTLAGKWLSGVLISKLLSSSLSGGTTSLVSTQPLYTVVLLHAWSFYVVAVLAIVCISCAVILAAMISSISKLRGAKTGRKLRLEIMDRAVGVSGVPQMEAATDLIFKAKTIETFQANEECWILFNQLKILVCTVLFFVFTWYGGVLCLAAIVISELAGSLIERAKAKHHAIVEQNDAQVGVRLQDVIKNSIKIKMMDMALEERRALEKQEEGSDEARRKDVELSFFLEIVKLWLPGLTVVIIAIISREIIELSNDPSKALNMGTAVLVTILLIDEVHKSMIHLQFMYDRQLTAKEAEETINIFLGKHEVSKETFGMFPKKRSGQKYALDKTSESYGTSPDEEFGPEETDEAQWIASKQRSYRTLTDSKIHALVLENIFLNYPGRKTPVLRAQTRSFGRGANHALVGESGSGKSTVLKVMAGVLLPDFGTARSWDDMKVAYVAQDQSLFARSIRENVSYGTKKGAIPDELVWDALKKANIAQWVKSLPGGLDAQLNEGERTVSGGQLQRLQLAHLFCTGQDADVILLDECLSALDKASRDILIDQLEKFLDGKTTIIVTHHSEMLRICNVVHDMASQSGDMRVAEERFRSIQL